MAKHPLEDYFGLTASELLDAINSRFRLKVAVGGAVAEVQMQKHVEKLDATLVERFEAHDIDGHPDFSIYVRGLKQPIFAECKNARNESYMNKGKLVNYRVEIQKTRASKEDPTSRLYGFEQFQILGVCLGNQTGDWSDFVFIRTVDLPPNALHPNKIQVMNRVPLIGGKMGEWSTDLEQIIRKFK
jgi:hypothetical protein